MGFGADGKQNTNQICEQRSDPGGILHRSNWGLCENWVQIILDEREIMDGTNRVNIKTGLRVLIVLKKDQHSGKLTRV